MKIAVRNGKDDKWKRIPNSEGSRSYEDMQELIHDIPELISLDGLVSGGSSLRICVKSDSMDDSSLIGIDENGAITVVECKIADGLSARREIMGRALEYAANLWEISYERFDSMVLDSEGKSLAEIMREKIQSEEWSEEEFRNAVNSALQQGKFRLIITVYELTTEMKQIIKFLNARGFETYALEIQYFSNGQIEIAVPRITGFSELESGTGDSTEMTGPAGKMLSSQAASPVEPAIAGPGESPKESDSAGPSVKKSERSAKATTQAEPEVAQLVEKDEQKEVLFFAKCEENAGKNAVETIKRLHAFSKEAADHIVWWGSGGAGAFNFVLTKDELTVFIVDAHGRIMFNFSDWQREPSYKNLLPLFFEKLKDIKVLSQQGRDYTRWPDFKVEEFFASDDDFAKFEESIKFLKTELGNLPSIK